MSTSVSFIVEFIGALKEATTIDTPSFRRARENGLIPRFPIVLIGNPDDIQWRRELHNMNAAIMAEFD
jgi:hypothetical protein